jgi:DNA-binding CsgD family transcriptional regulator
MRILSGYLNAARAISAEADGDGSRAAELLATWLDPALGFETKERFMWLSDLIRLALATGDLATAREAAAAAEADAAAGDALPRQALVARACRAQCDDDASTLLQVADGYQRYGWSLAQASCLEEAAVRLAQTGDTGAARAALTDAVRIYGSLGATRDVRRADARLRVHGVRRGPRGIRRRPTSGWEALTPAEQRVVELVAQGRSNPDIANELFLSRRTVQTHVSNVLTKLNLSSRLEIMREAAGR